MSETSPSDVHAEDISISVRNLHKYYGTVHALDGISFEVHKGQIVGFLGPNGAGKSTTMKVLTCFVAATGGTAEVAGRSVTEDPVGVRERVGYLPESVPLYDDMLVYDYLMYMASMRRVSRDRQADAVAEVIEKCGLKPVVGRAISELSKGYRQRVGLAQALVHGPEVLILDEPTSGLDPNQIAEIRDVIREVGRERTVLLSTHVMQEIEALCDRIVIINKGKIVADGTFEVLYAKYPEVDGLEALFRHLTAPQTVAPQTSTPKTPASNPNPTTKPEHTEDSDEGGES